MRHKDVGHGVEIDCPSDVCVRVISSLVDCCVLWSVTTDVFYVCTKCTFFFAHWPAFLF